jgi:hypothetical protein
MARGWKPLWCEPLILRRQSHERDGLQLNYFCTLYTTSEHFKYF